MTISPEYDEAIAYIEAIVADGVVASIGHTAATGDQIRAAVDAGARFSTHLGNGAHAMIRRHPNYIWDQLAEDRLTAGFIFDGQHLPPAVMKSVLRAKGLERTRPGQRRRRCGRPRTGRLPLPRRGAVELDASGRLALRGTPYLAGAAAALPTCIENAMRHAGVTLRDAVRMVTANPSRLLGLSPQGGFESLRVGATANMTVFRFAPDAGRRRPGPDHRLRAGRPRRNGLIGGGAASSRRPADRLLGSRFGRPRFRGRGRDGARNVRLHPDRLGRRRACATDHPWRHRRDVRPRGAAGLVALGSTTATRPGITATTATCSSASTPAPRSAGPPTAGRPSPRSWSAPLPCTRAPCTPARGRPERRARGTCTASTTTPGSTAARQVERTR